MTRRAVFDTNVLVSALGWSGPSSSLLDAALEGRIQLETSQHLLDELRTTLEFPRLAQVLASIGVNASTLVELVATAFEIVVPNRRVAVARDPDDNRVLEAAVAGEVDLIVTGDRDLLALSRFEAIPSSIRRARSLALVRMVNTRMTTDGQCRRGRL